MADDLVADIGEELQNLHEDEVIIKSDIMLCLGGDGTFLKCARKVFSKNSILG